MRTRRYFISYNDGKGFGYAMVTIEGLVNLKQVANQLAENNKIDKGQFIIIGFKELKDYETIKIENKTQKNYNTNGGRKND